MAAFREMHVSLQNIAMRDYQESVTTGHADTLANDLDIVIAYIGLTSHVLTIQNT